MATLAELCRAVDGELRGDGGVEITGVGSLEGAGAGAIAPLDSDRFLKAAQASRATAFLVSTKVKADFGRPCMRHAFPLVALNRVMEILGLVAPPAPPSIHPTAVVDRTARIGAEVYIGPYAVVGPRVGIGARSVSRSHVVVERGVTIGEDCVVEPGAVLHEGCVLGHQVHVGAHAVLSRQGFGFAAGPKGIVKLHHLGRVVLEDGAHVGAGTCVDRARFDETRIGAMSKLDNLIHIGHNCTVGKRTFIAAQTGMAGNAHIGDDCEIGGQVGVANRCGCGNRVRVGAQSGLIGMLPDGGEVWGTPARPRLEMLRQMAALKRLTRRP